MKVKRKLIEIDEQRCNGCGRCVPACAEGAIVIEDGKARVIAEKLCDGLGACLGECPEGALRIVEREAEDFDEQAVAEHLTAQKEREGPASGSPARGCPSARVQAFEGETHCPAKRNQSSMLSHWPVQIRLVPANAPFLKNADLLVASDCTAFASPGFHRDFLAGRTLLVGCPKLDDHQPFRDKFAEIFSSNDIRSVMVLMMEVPCCHAMPAFVRDGMRAAGKHVPLEIVTLSLRGEVLNRVHEAA